MSNRQHFLFATIVSITAIFSSSAYGCDDKNTQHPETIILRGSGILHGTPRNTQNHTFIPINVSNFTKGGVIKITISLGKGTSSASYDLFSTNSPSLTSDGRPIGSLANAYDVRPTTVTNLQYTFKNNSPKYYYLGISGNWFSSVTAENTYSYKITVTQ